MLLQSDDKREVTFPKVLPGAVTQAAASWDEGGGMKEPAGMKEEIMNVQPLPGTKDGSWFLAWASALLYPLRRQVRGEVGVEKAGDSSHFGHDEGEVQRGIK